MNTTTDYDDIISHPHHESDKRPRMSMEARAAQFSSFAALSGHSDAIKDAAEEHVEKLPDDYSDFD